MKGNEIMDNKELCYMLDLDPDTVEDVNITRKDEKYVFSIVMKRQTYECPECHSSHVNIKANKSKKLVGAQFNNCPSIFDENVQLKRHPMPRILLIDGFYFQRHSQQKYAFVMMNFENKVIVDIIKSRWQNVLSDYFYSIDAEKGKGRVCMFRSL